MARIVVAVSGGVDSVVLLDKLVRQNGHDLIVAHVDHGMRPESTADAAFVRRLAAHYRLPYEQTSLSLGAGASEATARHARYQFLRQVARRHEAVIATAHHSNDVAETIAINLVRGTGWRGVAVLDSEAVIRPLTSFTKQQLIAYATQHRLSWRDDTTNDDPRYLRNQLRPLLLARLIHDDVASLVVLRRRQQEQKRRLDQAVNELLRQLATPLSRYFFIMIDPAVADELLRRLCLDLSLQHGTTRRQRQALLHAIKTQRAGTQHRVTGEILLTLTQRHFSLQKTAKDAII